MTTTDREQLEALARKSESLRDAWLREREEVLLAQRTANAELLKRWNLPEPLILEPSDNGEA